MENNEPVSQPVKPAPKKRAPKKKTETPVLATPTTLEVVSESPEIVATPELLVREDINATEPSICSDVTANVPSGDQFDDILVESFVFENHTFYIDQTNCVYHHETLTPIGTFDPVSYTINYL
jgi:hypothetical protein